MVAKRHHFVSQCYLKGFSVDRSTINVFDRIQRKVFGTGTENVALERHFNRIEGVDGQPADILEKRIADFESVLAPAIKRIEEVGTLENPDDHATILQFIAMLFLRNPRFRATMNDMYQQTANMLFESLLSSKEIWDASLNQAAKAGAMSAEHHIDYETAKALMKKTRFEVQVPNERHIEVELELLDKTTGIFFQRRWKLLRAPKGSPGFITCDHPVVLMWSDPKDRSGIYGPGLAVPHTYITFSLTNGLALVGAFELEEGVLDVDEEKVAAVNGGTIAFARRQVFAKNDTFFYQMQPDEEPIKGSKLIDDLRFLRTEKVARSDDDDIVAEDGA